MTVSNVRLSNNFRLKEFFTDKQHPDKAARLFDECTDYQVSLAYIIADDLQTMRDFINELIQDKGDIGITITSGFRDPELNAAQTGGAKKSLHTKMRAADIKTKDPDHLKKIYKFITLFSELTFRECFIYVTTLGVPTNIHYAKRAPGYTDRRHGIYVRPPHGGKPQKLEDYIKSLSDGGASIFRTNLDIK